MAAGAADIPLNVLLMESSPPTWGPADEGGVPRGCENICCCFCCFCGSTDAVLLAGLAIPNPDGFGGVVVAGEATPAAGR